VPQAGLLGSIAGIGLALIGFIPMVDIFGLPLVGLVSLGLILYNLVARVRLPGNLPGVLAAVAVGTALYHLLGPAGLVGGTYAAPHAAPPRLPSHARLHQGVRARPAYRFRAPFGLLGGGRHQRHETPRRRRPDPRHPLAGAVAT
jgi:hypothetical protein